MTTTATTARSPWLVHFGFTRTPFTKSLAPGELFGRGAHHEAVARILHCVAEAAVGVVTGEVGAGKTVAARAARASLDPSRHALIYIANPAFGTRGLYVSIVRALGATPPLLPGRGDGPGPGPARGGGGGARPAGRARGG
jgi:type II secretory pathway predicted ATPase ExeA